MSIVTSPVQRGALAIREAEEKALGLRDLRSFLTVAETGSLRRAALELGVSQPAISLQLKKLEEGLGLPLLLRHGRGVTVTAAGACLRDRARTVLQLMASPLEEAKPEQTPQGTISFAAPAEMASSLLADIVLALRARWPDVILHIRQGNGSDVEEWLLHRLVDLAVTPDTISLPEVEMVPILIESLGLVVPPYAQMASGAGPISLRELRHAPLILPPPNHWLRRRLDRASQQCGLSVSPIVQCDSLILCKALVLSGAGFTILPQSVANAEVANRTLTFRPMKQPEVTCTSGIAFHRAALSKGVASFASIVSDRLVKFAEAGA